MTDMKFPLHIHIHIHRFCPDFFFHRYRRPYIVLVQTLNHAQSINHRFCVDIHGYIRIHRCLFCMDISADCRQSSVSFYQLLHCESKKLGHFLRPTTLEILNRYLPNLAQITFSSRWTSCHNLFESTWENSGAIWRITLTVNKKVIKVMNWQWLRHAVVSAMLLTLALLILSTEEKLWWW